METKFFIQINNNLLILILINTYNRRLSVQSNIAINFKYPL